MKEVLNFITLVTFGDSNNELINHVNILFEMLQIIPFDFWILEILYV